MATLTPLCELVAFSSGMKMILPEFNGGGSDFRLYGVTIFRMPNLADVSGFSFEDDLANYRRCGWKNDLLPGRARPKWTAFWNFELQYLA